MDKFDSCANLLRFKMVQANEHEFEYRMRTAIENLKYDHKTIIDIQYGGYRYSNCDSMFSAMIIYK